MTFVIVLSTDSFHRIVVNQSALSVIESYIDSRVEFWLLSDSVRKGEKWFDENWTNVLESSSLQFASNPNDIMRQSDWVIVPISVHRNVAHNP